MLIITPPPEQKSAEPASSEFKTNEGEMSLIRKEHFGAADAYTTALWRLIFIADAEELAKLATIYPLHIEAYINYKNVPGWFDNLVSRAPHRRRTDER